ncbi:hypothetical protein AA15237_1174 [Komagataeibacter xylinus NBRC 15237]|nr:hypothetical protein AA15237_1174 [Komagataeibacter xylinus NBRC 15237]
MRVSATKRPPKMPKRPRPSGPLRRLLAPACVSVALNFSTPQEIGAWLKGLVKQPSQAAMSCGSGLDGDKIPAPAGW